MKREHLAVLALGSNLGDRLASLQNALDALRAAPGVALRGVSPVYETDAVGGPDQPRYLNAVLVVRTSLDPHALLAQAHAVEQQLGRTRDVRWGPRTIDVDLIAVDDQILADPLVTLPHPRAHERAFVLAPWQDVDPSAVVPGHGPVAELLHHVDTRGVRRRDDLGLAVPA